LRIFRYSSFLLFRKYRFSLLFLQPFYPLQRFLLCGLLAVIARFDPRNSTGISSKPVQEIHIKPMHAYLFLIIG